MKISIKDFLSKYNQIRIWSHLLQKSLMQNFIFCAVYTMSMCNQFLYCSFPLKLESVACNRCYHNGSKESIKRYTTQKMKFSIKDFFSKCDQIRRKLRIWSHLLTKSLMENFIFCAVQITFNSDFFKYLLHTL